MHPLRTHSLFPSYEQIAEAEEHVPLSANVVSVEGCGEDTLPLPDPIQLSSSSTVFISNYTKEYYPQGQSLLEVKAKVPFYRNLPKFQKRLKKGRHAR